MENEKIMVKEFFCYLCSLQFHSKTVYEMHISLLHNKKDENRTEAFTEIKMTEIKKKNEVPRKKPHDKIALKTNDAKKKHTV